MASLFKNEEQETFFYNFPKLFFDDNDFKEVQTKLFIQLTYFLFCFL